MTNVIPAPPTDPPNTRTDPAYGGSSKEDYEVHLKIVLELLKMEKLFVMFSKCEFWLNKVHFLRHVVNSKGIHMDPSEIEAIKNWKIPKTQSKIRSFLGLTEPWTDDELRTESFGSIHHECNPLRFKNGTALWPTCNWKEDGYCNTRGLPGFIQEENQFVMKIMNESMNMMEESSDDEWDHDSLVDEWKDYEHNTYIKTNVSSNQNTYNNVCQIVKDHCKTQEEQGWFDEHELIGDDDDDIGYFKDYLCDTRGQTRLV
ncbi:hypothetical protein Tco_0098495 [Tanacetum coccineum]